jgi:hypothetical protein
MKTGKAFNFGWVWSRANAILQSDRNNRVGQRFSEGMGSRAPSLARYRFSALAIERAKQFPERQNTGVFDGTARLARTFAKCRFSRVPDGTICLVRARKYLEKFNDVIPP